MTVLHHDCEGLTAKILIIEIISLEKLKYEFITLERCFYTAYRMQLSVSLQIFP